ncbi:MAG: alpha-L-fucosidase, partial [Cyclobacteriaceae bacterium]|nr:alpha-L-fucosidase [Cyclobacteriaceae bacterium]
DPSKQEAYNKVFRQQLTETLANYGEAIEVWFDGSCVIDVSDILEKYAKNSVVFQGPHATLRWPGTESGKLFYPVWNTVKSEDFETGVSTQVHGDPNGDIWAPLETNTTLYEHFWFWSPTKMKEKKSLDQLMECYYKSVGYGSVFLLNSTPDTTGLIPLEDVELYKAFGEEIDRRFNSPLAVTNNQKGDVIDLPFPENLKINHAVTMEDYQLGQRIREYKIEGFSDGAWAELYKGQSIGRKKIDYFDEIEVSKIRLKIIKSVGEPSLKSLAAFFVEDFIAPVKQGISPWSAWQNLRDWELKEGDEVKIELDLTGKINLPGQFTVKIVSENTDTKVTISDVKLFYEGNPALDKFTSVSGDEININRTAQVTDESKIIVYFNLKCKADCKGKIDFRPALIY